MFQIKQDKEKPNIYLVNTYNNFVGSYIIHRIGNHHGITGGYASTDQWTFNETHTVFPKVLDELFIFRDSIMELPSLAQEKATSDDLSMLTQKYPKCGFFNGFDKVNKNINDFSGEFIGYASRSNRNEIIGKIFLYDLRKIYSIFIEHKKYCENIRTMDGSRPNEEFSMILLGEVILRYHLKLEKAYY